MVYCFLCWGAFMLMLFEAKEERFVDTNNSYIITLVVGMLESSLFLEMG